MSFLSNLLSPFGKILSFIRYKYDRLRLNNAMNNGLNIGKNVYVQSGVIFDQNYPFLISIGDNCRISQDVKILAHDATLFRILGVTRIAPVKILDGCFIGERVLILPGVTIGPNALIAAGSIVNRDIGEGKVAAGNPARVYGNFSDLIEKYKKMITSKRVFSKTNMEKGLISSTDILDHFQSDSIAFSQGVPEKDPYYINTNMDEMRDSAVKAFEEVKNFLGEEFK